MTNFSQAKHVQELRGSCLGGAAALSKPSASSLASFTQGERLHFEASVKWSKDWLSFGMSELGDFTLNSAML
jgi:hypothetical protein